MYLFTVLEARSPRSGPPQCWFLLKLGGRVSSMPLTELLAVFWQSLVLHGMNKLHTDLCLQLHKAFTPPPSHVCVYVQMFPFCRVTCCLRLGTHPPPE